MKRSLLVALFTLFALTASVTACRWDYDTLRDERRGLPGIAEILAGRWERHSQFFYEDRIRRMNELIAREPNNLDAWDNRAAAYEQVGQMDKAMETILAKDKLKPGQYTTHANLGTFYLHAGNLEAGIAEIRKALDINPEAHFGREKYQLKVAEWLLAKKNGDTSLGETFISLQYPPQQPDSPKRPAASASPEEMAAYRAALEAQGPSREAWLKELQRIRTAWVADREPAIQGIVGMIRFGTGKSPDLYAGLGELLAARGDVHLAYRAFNRARDLGFQDSAWLSERMTSVSGMTEDKAGFDLTLIANERREADEWVAAYQTFEDDLIRAGKDPADESLFAPFYDKHGTARQSVEPSVTDNVRKTARSPGAVIAIFALVPIVLLVGLRFLRRALLATPA